MNHLHVHRGLCNVAKRNLGEYQLEKMLRSGLMREPGVLQDFAGVSICQGQAICMCYYLLGH